MERVGTRAQVMHGNAKMTGGGLKKKDLKYNKQGKIVSKKMSIMAKKEKRLQKAGYTTVKGKFGAVRIMKGGAGVGDMSHSEFSNEGVYYKIRSQNWKKCKITILYNNYTKMSYISIYNIKTDKKDKDTYYSSTVIDKSYFNKVIDIKDNRPGRGWMGKTHKHNRIDIFDGDLSIVQLYFNSSGEKQLFSTHLNKYNFKIDTFSNNKISNTYSAPNISSNNGHINYGNGNNGHGNNGNGNNGRRNNGPGNNGSGNNGNGNYGSGNNGRGNGMNTSQPHGMMGATYNRKTWNGMNERTGAIGNKL
jgi:hypothetical protein